ncbi:MAG: ATP synthase F1 subunit epsilon [Anaerovoracaceae bacterium]
MSKAFTLEIITPEKLFFKGTVESVIVPMEDGQETFMADHAWVCQLLKVGELKLKEEGQMDFRIAAIAEGFIDVKDTIIIYTDVAEWAEDIDYERAKAKKMKMESWLNEKNHEDPEDIRLAQIDLAKASARIKVRDHLKR